jgi:hypothetical protein
MRIDMEEKENKSSETDSELVSFVMDRVEKYTDHRDSLYFQKWDEYERLWRGVWTEEDRIRDSERSKMISPALQQAIETRQSEISEAVFGKGEFFDVTGDPETSSVVRQKLHYNFKKDKIRKSIEHIVLLAEVFGTGIGEVVITEVMEKTPDSRKLEMTNLVAVGTTEQKRFKVDLKPVHPRNFFIDPNSPTVEDAFGCGIEEYVSIHKVLENIESGVYRDVDISPMADDTNIEPSREAVTFSDDKVKLVKYFGLVPSALLKLADPDDDEEVEDLFDDDEYDGDEMYDDLVEAIVVIGNDSVLLKAERNPYMMQDRPIIAYQCDTMPNRFWGRGTAEKGYNMQKAIDAQLRAHFDNLALTTAPMMAMDASRMPRGMKFEVRPGKSILTNGNPSEILFPVKFGQTDPANYQTVQDLERMLLMATGTLDSSGMPSAVSGDAKTGAMSMALSGIIKKNKRTLVNFQEDFLIPFVYKAAHRYMQFDPQNFPAKSLEFVPLSTMGIMAREYEQQQFIGLLQTVGPDSAIMPLVLKGIVSNSSLSNKEELEQALSEMSKPNPEQQQAQQMQAQLQQAQIQAQIELFNAQAAEYQAKAAEAQARAQKVQMETQVIPYELKIEEIKAINTNLPEDPEDKIFQRRAKMAELMLKEKDIDNYTKQLELQERTEQSKMQLEREKLSQPKTSKRKTVERDAEGNITGMIEE